MSKIDDLKLNEEQTKVMTNNISNAFKTVYESNKEYFDNLKKMRENMLVALEPLQKVLEPIQEQAKKYQENISKIDFSWLSQLPKLEINQEIFNEFRKVAKLLEGSPLTTEERNVVAHKAIQYANFGMTYPLNEIFDELPEMNNDLANQICEECSTGQTYDDLLKALRELEYKNEQQVEDAIKTYENGMYYACISTLFDIIVREFTSRQPSKEITGNRRNTINNTKIKKLKVNPINKNHSFQFFIEVNFIYLTSYYFRNGEDFLNESYDDYPVVNRNFIAHGMTNRKITKIDCIKLLMYIWFIKYEYEYII